MHTVEVISHAHDIMYLLLVMWESWNGKVSCCHGWEDIKKYPLDKLQKVIPLLLRL